MAGTSHIGVLVGAAALAMLWACGDEPVGPGPDSTGSVAITTPSSTSITVGDELELLATATGSGAPRWSAADTSVAEVTGGGFEVRVEARRPGVTEIVAALEGGASDRVSLTVLERPGGYSTAAVDYFAEIAFGSEYGSAEPAVRRWRAGPKLQVKGSPTARDRWVLNGVLEEINALAGIDAAVVDSMPSVEVHFAPQTTFPDLLPSYVPGNVGFFSVWWDATQHIYRAVVLISSELDQTARDHIIREEVTQILGLMRDSFRYPESIFYQNWSLVDRYSSLDEILLEMLYRPELLVGTPPAEAVQVLRTLTGAPASAVVPFTESKSYRSVGRPGWASGGGAR